MGRHLFTFAVLLLTISACDTANNTERRYNDYFIKYFGTDGDQFGADLHVNDDGTMLILGNSLAPSGQRRPFLIKTDPKGNQLWETFIGENETAVDIELIKNGVHAGGFLIATNAAKGNTNKPRIWRISASGTFIDSITVNPVALRSSSQTVRSITALVNGNDYIIAGSADGSLMAESDPEISSPEQDILVFRINETFSNVENIVHKGGELGGAAVKVMEMQAGQLVMFSYTDRPFQSNEFEFNFSYDILYAGVPVGSVVGTRGAKEVLASVVRTPPILGEGYLMAGTSSSGSGIINQIYLAKFNSTFEYKAFDKIVDIGRNVQCVAAEAGDDGYYIISDELIDANRKNMVLVKVTSDGQAEWTKTFGTFDGEDTGAAISKLPDGRIAIVGTMQLRTRKKLALIVVDGKGRF